MQSESRSNCKHPVWCQEKGYRLRHQPRNINDLDAAIHVALLGAHHFRIINNTFLQNYHPMVGGSLKIKFLLDRPKVNFSAFYFV